jgi:hypothetical protein
MARTARRGLRWEAAAFLISLADEKRVRSLLLSAAARDPGFDGSLRVRLLTPLTIISRSGCG